MHSIAISVDFGSHLSRAKVRKACTKNISLYFVFSRIKQIFILNPRDVTLVPTIKCPAITISAFLGAFGGLMGLVAGISVFSIIELAFTILKFARLICCKAKVYPIVIVQPKTPHQKFELNQKHLFYHLGLNFVKFLKESGIHGVHYIKDKNLNCLEKIFWIISIAISTILCSIFIIDSLESIHEKSVIIGFDEKIFSKEEVSLDTVAIIIRKMILQFQTRTFLSFQKTLVLVRA